MAAGFLRLVGPLLALLSGAPAWAEPGPVHVFAEELPCPHRAELAAETSRRIAPLPRSEEPLHVGFARVAPDRVELRLEQGERSHRRLLRASSSDCAALPQTVALVAESWLRQSWRRHAGAAAPATVELPRTEPARTPLQGKDVVLSGSASSGAALMLAAQAGGFSGSARQRGFALRACADWGFTARWGLGLQAGYDSPVSGGALSGRVVASVSTLGVLGRATLLTTRSTALDVLAGPALAIVSARTAGYDWSMAQALPDLAIALAVRGRYRLSDHLVLVLSSGLDIRTHAETFTIGDRAMALRIGRTRIDASVGFAWSPF